MNFRFLVFHSNFLILLEQKPIGGIAVLPPSKSGKNKENENVNGKPNDNIRRW